MPRQFSCCGPSSGWDAVNFGVVRRPVSALSASTWIGPSPVSGQPLAAVYRKSAERNDDGAFHYTRSTWRHGRRHHRLDGRQRWHGRDRTGWNAAAVHTSARAASDRAAAVSHRRLSLDEPACHGHEHGCTTVCWPTSPSVREPLAPWRDSRFVQACCWSARLGPRLDSSSIRATRASHCWFDQTTSGRSCPPVSAPASFAGHAAWKYCVPIRPRPGRSSAGESAWRLPRQGSLRCSKRGVPSGKLPRSSCWKHSSWRCVRPTNLSLPAWKEHDRATARSSRSRRITCSPGIGERVHVSDLCRAADVSERTLE